MGTLFDIQSKQNSYSLPRDEKHEGMHLTSEPMDTYWRKYTLSTGEEAIPLL
jgi:hypothetical protein